MKKQHIIVGVTTAALLAAAASAASSDSFEQDSDELVGVFSDASPLEAGSEVRLQGVRIGSVRDIELHDGKAWVIVGVDPDTLPLHEDATMVLKPVNLLGEFYIDVRPGTDSAPMLEDGIITAEHTDSAVTIQQVLDTLDDPTSVALASVITGLGEGLDDAGADTAAALEALAPAMSDAARLGDILSDQNQVLAQLLDRAAPVAAALSQDEGQVLERVVQSAENMLSAVAAQQEAADATLLELPSTLVAARRTLNRLAGLSDDLTPTLKVLRPVTDDLDQLSRQLRSFADSADPALASLEPVLEHADALMDRAAPVVAQLNAAGPALRGTASNLRPLGNELLDKHLGDLMAFVKKWSLSTNGKDALSHYFRGVFHVTPNTLADLAASVLPELTPAAKPKKAGGKSGPKSVLPDVLGGLGLDQLADALGLDKLGLNGLLGGNAKASDKESATGLSQQQEKNLLGLLLGGR